MAPVESPFAVLTAVVAPALLTNSSTVLVLGLGTALPAWWTAPALWPA